MAEPMLRDHATSEEISRPVPPNLQLGCCQQHGFAHNGQNVDEEYKECESKGNNKAKHDADENESDEYSGSRSTTSWYVMSLGNHGHL